MQLCREDGVLLKPDRPATAIDSQFQAMLFGAWPGREPGEQCAPRPPNGAVQISASEVDARAEAMFPTRSAGHRKAAAISGALMEQIEAKRALDAECRGGFGAPQGPLGEIYSTHATIRSASGTPYTWRYVVGVQVASMGRGRGRRVVPSSRALRALKVTVT